MTVETQVSRVSHDTDGINAAYPVPFYFLDASHLTVIRVTAEGAATTLTLTTDYTVAGAGAPSGGTVTLNTTPAAGGRVVIILDPPVTQLSAYQSNARFPAASHERALDKGTMIDQRTRDMAGRALRLPDHDLDGSSGFDARGYPVRNAGRGTDNGDLVVTEQLAELGFGNPDAFGITIARRVQSNADLGPAYPGGVVITDGSTEPGDGAGGGWAYDPTDRTAEVASDPRGIMFRPAITGGPGAWVRQGTPKVDVGLFRYGRKLDSTRPLRDATEYCLEMVARGKRGGHSYILPPETIDLDDHWWINSTGDEGGQGVDYVKIEGAGVGSTTVVGRIRIGNPQIADGGQLVNGQQMASNSVYLSEFRLRGGYDIYGAQRASGAWNVKLDPLPGCYVSPYDGEAYGAYIFGANNFSIEAVRHDNIGALVPGYPGINGILVDTCPSFLMLRGSCNYGKRGIVFRSSGRIGSTGSAGIKILSTYMEGNEKEAIVLENVNGAQISCQISGTDERDTDSPMVRIGNDGSRGLPAYEASAVSVMNCNITHDAGQATRPNLVGVLAENVRGFYEEKNRFVGQPVGIKLTAGVKEYAFDPSRATGSVATKYVVDPAATRATFPVGVKANFSTWQMRQVVSDEAGTLPIVSNVAAWDVAARPTPTLTLASGSAVDIPVPTNMPVKTPFYLRITKTSASGNVTWSGTWDWRGNPAAPTFAAIATDKEILISLSSKDGVLPSVHGWSVQD